MAKLTKFQKAAQEVSSALPALTEVQRKWAIEERIKYQVIVNSKKKGTCLFCGGEFKVSDINNPCVCPHCGKTVIPQVTRKRVFNQYDYFVLCRVHKGLQVIRYFWVTTKMRVGKAAQSTILEAYQYWLDEKGNTALIRRNKKISFWYYDMWDFNKKMKPFRMEYDLDCSNVDVYPRMSVLPILKRNGFNNDFHEIAPFGLLYNLMKDNRVETLFKCQQYGLLSQMSGHYEHTLNRYWQPIKVCLRNKYEITDFQTWKDYIDLLTNFHMDTHNAHYVCPANLIEAHDQLVVRRHNEWERLRQEQDEARKLKQLADMEQDNQNYVRERAKFFDLCISDGEMEIKILKSVEEFKEEGEKQHICVFSNEYYKDFDSLILSARINNKRIATIELSLSDWEIVQCRAVCNGQSPHQERIIRLIKNNIKQIKQCQKAA